MRKSMHSRGVKTLLAAVSALLLFALTAAAYFAATSGGSGSGEKKLGYGESVQLTYTVSFNEGLKPGEQSPVRIATTNSTAKPTDIATWSLVPAIDEAHAKAGCQASWFEVAFKVASGEAEWPQMLEKAKTLPIPAGETVIVSGGEKEENWGKWGAEYYVRFKEEPVNQSACEGATLTLVAKSTA